MLTLDSHLNLDRCPQCSIDRPNLVEIHHIETKNYKNQNIRFWIIYKCVRCGDLITAYANRRAHQVQAIFPDLITVDDNIPSKAKEFLKQAIESKHAPVGSIMLCASSVDAMLKEKGFKKGNMYSRIDKAATDHLITSEMATWAHQVRLDANDQRHADEEADLPNEKDATKTIDFTLALAEFLFVLPSRIEKGLEETEPEVETK